MFALHGPCLRFSSPVSGLIYSLPRGKRSEAADLQLGLRAALLLCALDKRCSDVLPRDLAGRALWNGINDPDLYGHLELSRDQTAKSASHKQVAIPPYDLSSL